MRCVWFCVRDTKKGIIPAIVRATVPNGATLHTDALMSYASLGWNFLPDPIHDRLGTMLWQQAQVGGGGMGLDFAKKIIPALVKIPESDVVLVIGENDAFMQGMPGQDGEAFDHYGGAVPPP